MILKNYEINKINLNLNKLILFYGKNEGYKNEEILRIIKNNKDYKVSKYDEKEILENPNIFFNSVFSKSLFEEKKIIIINQSTDKILKIINEISNKEINDISMILNGGILEKKSKLRSLFEKEKKFTCIAFYPDTHETLSKIVYNFLKKKKILISQSKINLIVNRCNGERLYLENELQKIENYSISNKNITTENLLKLTNLSENFGISELIDNCLAKNQKKTINILNENNFSNEDCILITRIFLNKSKRILKLSKEYQKNKDINKTIMTAKPPIFWKDKEIVKQQINKWTPKKINELIINLNEIELLIKKNYFNPINIISDFILDQSCANN